MSVNAEDYDNVKTTVTLKYMKARLEFAKNNNNKNNYNYNNNINYRKSLPNVGKKSLDRQKSRSTSEFPTCISLWWCAIKSAPPAAN